MHIQGPAHLHGAQAINAPHRVQPSQAAAASSPTAGVDQVDISHEADMVSRAREMARELPDVRMDRVAEIRAQIAAGTYETEEKLDLALGRMLDEIG